MAKDVTPSMGARPIPKGIRSLMDGGGTLEGMRKDPEIAPHRALAPGKYGIRPRPARVFTPVGLKPQAELAEYLLEGLFVEV
jgi:hypothetical protein